MPNVFAVTMTLWRCEAGGGVYGVRGTSPQPIEFVSIIEFAVAHPDAHLCSDLFVCTTVRGCVAEGQVHFRSLSKRLLSLHCKWRTN